MSAGIVFHFCDCKMEPTAFLMLQYCRYGDKTRAAHNTEPNFLFPVHVLQNKSTHYVLFYFRTHQKTKSHSFLTLRIICGC